MPEIDNNPKRAGGLAKWLMTIAAAFAFGSLIVYLQQDAIAAWTAVASAEQRLDALKLTEEQKEAAMQPIRDYAELVKDGKVSVAQRDAIEKSLGDGAVPVMLTLLSLETQFISISPLTEEEKLSAHKEIGRYCLGIMAGKINRETLRKIADVLSENVKEHIGKEKSIVPESGIPVNALREFTKGLKEESDKAGIDDKTFEVDLAGAIKQAIDNGLGVRENSAVQE